jgi:PAS domain S-box-containing protein/putative nucleotidyltransferase with HDIG domain
VTYTQDITERKLAIEELHLREERYRSLIETQISLISRCDLKGRFTFVNDAYCRAFGKTREELIGQSFISNVLPEDRDIALKSHKSLFDPPHRYTVEDRSITTAGLRWLQWEGSVVRDNQGNIIELQGVGTDITEQKQNQLELQKSLDQLSKTIEGTIETIALIVEARDPYTAGHQKRVADISVRIAEELGLPEEQIRGIYMAGIIHDVGKIQVPAEILSKPGQLTKLEFDLIKIHPEVGYDLLKGIEFPWPIAQIIYQHHERVDGSGYPRRLKGKDILLEAKIIGIADVIEAMSSHRPYRPALGLDVSLKEIQMNRGTLYDKELVEIYLKVFKNGYRFDEIK